MIDEEYTILHARYRIVQTSKLYKQFLLGHIHVGYSLNILYPISTTWHLVEWHVMYPQKSESKYILIVSPEFYIRQALNILNIWALLLLFCNASNCFKIQRKYI